MSNYDLKDLIDTVELKKLKFDGYEFELEFVNGVTVTVAKDAEYGIAVWDISSTVDNNKKASI